MNKNLRIVLILAAVAGVAYVAYRWYEAKVAASGTGLATGQLGTNLNSIAPELVGGSEAGGTQVAPAVSVPVNITMSSSSTMPALNGPPDSMMQPLNQTTPNGVQNSDGSNGANPVNPGGPDVTVSSGKTPPPTVQPGGPDKTVKKSAHKKPRHRKGVNPGGPEVPA